MKLKDETTAVSKNLGPFSTAHQEEESFLSISRNQESLLGGLRKQESFSGVPQNQESSFVVSQKQKSFSSFESGSLLESKQDSSPYSNEASRNLPYKNDPPLPPLWKPSHWGVAKSVHPASSDNDNDFQQSSENTNKSISENDYLSSNTHEPGVKEPKLTDTRESRADEDNEFFSLEQVRFSFCQYHLLLKCLSVYELWIHMICRQ